MNTQTQEALKMAIEALEFFQKNSEFWKDTVEEAIQACKEALTQPAQEPMAWMNDEGFGLYPTNDTAIPLYTHPAPSWQGLSDDEIEAVTGEDIRSMYSGTYNSYRAIEQALKEKNHG